MSDTPLELRRAKERNNNISFYILPLEEMLQSGDSRRRNVYFCIGALIERITGLQFQLCDKPVLNWLRH